ncbi:recombinase family protein [Streptomyces platensis]|uniref:recombinase family protein n=1 Tax=Streptomyces platensis TaxID=58346 RepID=UPI002E801118|nr:recombinase family protein [Streptomyces platensis]WUB78879.1 recombinase family protein [Streptomyces platensis]
MAASGLTSAIPPIARACAVRVSTDKQKTQHQHDALDAICLKVFEEKISGKLAVDDRPGLTAALALAEDRRRDIVKKTKNGLDSARARGRVGGRRPVVDDDKRRVILARRAEGQSIREIAAAVKVSVGVVHKTLNPEAAPVDS